MQHLESFNFYSINRILSIFSFIFNLILIPEYTACCVETKQDPETNYRFDQFWMTSYQYQHLNVIVVDFNESISSVAQPKNTSQRLEKQFEQAT